jgi:hypothetical protein
MHGAVQLFDRKILNSVKEPDLTYRQKMQRSDHADLQQFRDDQIQIKPPPVLFLKTDIEKLTELKEYMGNLP